MSLPRVLMVHAYYRRAGGEDRSFEAETRMLRDAGVDVRTFVRRNEDLAAAPAWRAAAGAVWSTSSARALRAALAETGPYDVVHVQNTFPILSPAVLWVARRSGAAVVQSLRNFRFMCVNGLLFRDGHVCEACLGRAVAWPGVVHRCYRASLPASASVATLNVVHRALGTWRTQVDRFVAMSAFTKAKYVAAGWDPGRIAVKPNALAHDPGPGPGDGGYAVYVGRLAEGKGVETLLAAMAPLSRDISLWVVGAGPLEGLVRRAAEAGLVRWRGELDMAATLDVIGRARVLIVPSEGYETFGRVVIEAYARGTPVVAARSGALPELVEEGRTGRTFAPGDADDLRRQVQAVWDAEDGPALRRAARRAFDTDFTAEQNVEATLALYRDAIEAAHDRGGHARSPVGAP